MRVSNLLLLGCFFFSFLNRASAQIFQKLEVHGKVVDKKNNYTLSTATVSLFDADSVLISYLITNTYGDFSIKKDKLKFPCQLRISNIGYAIKIIELKSNPKDNIFNLGEIDLQHQYIMLNEVEIKLAPVTLNGDTLEFNPAAFKLDSNAVLDDLLKEIPNVTVWNDGQITVNGREIKSLVVNGKQFFGSDFNIATKNLPSKIIQKVQVYNKNEKGTSNPLDSLLEMNIKLKKGMEKGVFGKASGGMGTSKYYEGEGSLNYFSTKLQVSIAAMTNNTNKIADDLQMLLKNSTYKAGISDLDYQSNFTIPGLNRVKSVGTNFVYDLFKIPKLARTNEISGSYFRQNLNLEQQINTTSLRYNGIDDQNSEIDNTVSRKNIINDKLALKYTLLTGSSNLVVNAQKSDILKDQNRSISTTARNYNLQLLSSYNGLQQVEEDNSNYRFSVKYEFDPKLTNYKQFSVPFSASYVSSISNNNANTMINTVFSSNTTPSASKNYNRIRNAERQINRNQIDLNVDLDQLVFGRSSAKVNISAQANIDLRDDFRDDKVWDGLGTFKKLNTYLTNVNQANLGTYTYGLEFAKNYNRFLTDRFHKSINISFNPKVLNNIFSSKGFNERQKIMRSENTFLPEAKISLFKQVFGKYRTRLSMNYDVDVNYPTLDQFVPIVDSTEVYNLRGGNLNLYQEKINSVRLQFSRENFNNNSFIYQMGAGLNFSSNKIVDSILVSSDNRQQIISTNADGYLMFNFDGQIRKSIKFKSSDLKLQLNGNVTRTHMPTYLNNLSLINKQWQSTVSFSLSYTYKKIVNLELKETGEFYQFEQMSANNKFSGTTLIHSLNSSFLLTKRLSINSNININTNKSSGLDNKNFTIWNIYIVQRFLKQSNAEIKLSGLDLLKQNQNIQNKIGANYFTTVTQNSLSRYFLLSLSFYPRKFGK